jgi:predicted flap endonuclease-1-like 5' DNA nuclease
MEVGLFVLSILIGAAATWYLQDRYRQDDATAREANFEARLAALQDELKQSDAALAETKDRLIALQMEQKARDGRGKPLEEELAQARRAAEQAMEMEAKQRQACATLQDEVARLKRELAGRAKAPAKRVAAPAPPAPAPAPAEAAASSTAPTSGNTDDLTRIRGIGKVIERKLHELGITTFRQLADLSAADVQRVNQAIDFPGRVERERWVEQARGLTSR